MPFSLILNDNNSNNNASVVPGWLIKSSPYTIERNEVKYQTRLKAARHTYYTSYPIVRIQTIHQCYIARNELIQAAGTGQNGNMNRSTSSRLSTTYPISMKAMQDGIRTYTDFIQRYALTGLYQYLLSRTKQNSYTNTTNPLIFSNNPDSIIQHLREQPTISDEIMMTKLFYKISSNNSSNQQIREDGIPWPVFPWDSPESSGEITTWDYQRYLLQKEFSSILFDDNGNSTTKNSNNTSGSNIRLILEELLVNHFLKLEIEYTHRVCSCKERDDIRGIRTVPGYSESHVLVHNDPVIDQVNRKLQQTKDNVQKIVNELSYDHPITIATTSKL
jgi:hypothetical protein